MKIKKILYMGSYLREYARNYNIIEGLKHCGVKVDEYNVSEHGIMINLRKFIKKFRKLKNEPYDMILLHSEAPIQSLLAKMLSIIKGIPLIHDIYISKLQTLYDDRKKYRSLKIPKLIYWLVLYVIDFLECQSADYLLLDTYTHINYFHTMFNIPIKKFRRILIGAQDGVFYPMESKKKNKNEFVVGFYGTYIPVQGVEFIIKAAKILEEHKDVLFILVGNGQTYEKNRKLATELGVQNIQFINYVPLRKLAELMSQWDVGLGMFRDVPRCMQSIPNKVWGGIAMKIPMINCESPAIKELFEDRTNIVLCKPDDPQSLAKKILLLKKNPDLREKIKNNAYQLFLKYGTIDAIGVSSLNILKQCLNE